MPKVLFRFFDGENRTYKHRLRHVPFVLALSLIALSQSVAQSRFPLDYFTSPIDTPLKLSGGFAELRNNHLHGGLDFRTGGEEGLPIYAAADGYVGRIRVSGHGYGNCLYIIHPIGYTTVYGHLLSFEEPIRSWVNRRHHELQENELDLWLKEDEIPVSKDQLLALSGNTGASGGPHLHFEIRHTETEELINPHWFGLRVADNVRPTFDCMEVVPLGPGSLVGGKPSPLRLQFLQDSTGFWRAKKEAEVAGACHVQVKVWDKHTENELRQGIYQLLLIQGLDTLYAFKADRYAHSETRYANSVMDYEAKMLNNETFYRLFRSPGNHLRLINAELSNGILHP
ncbi:MAG: M23 family metallopeptidase, partial [Bacteroidetes bacterium]|nr:M23 family metallopeptidase [Bacteroidota bacterium]